MLKDYMVHSGVIKLDNMEIPCYVLNFGDEEIRVLSQREVVKLISGGRESGALQKYLKARALESTLPPEIRHNYSDNILIFNTGTVTVNGVKASTVIDICNAYIKSHQLGLLQHSQIKLAIQSQVFVSACAKVGIDAIIDEATGYEYFKKNDRTNIKKKYYWKGHSCCKKKWFAI